MDDLMLRCRHEINKEAALPRRRRAVEIAVCTCMCRVYPAIKDLDEEDKTERGMERVNGYIFYG